MWWKCLLWTAIGCGVGAAVATFLPEPGMPANGTRLSTERFVIDLAGGNTSEEAISNVVLYPPRQGVRLIRFDYTVDGQSTAGYAFAGEPMLQLRQLQDLVDDSGRYPPTRPEAIYATRLAPAANAAIAAISVRPGQQWKSATECFDFQRVARPAFTYKQAWWTTSVYLWNVPIIAGAVLIGMAGSILTRRTAEELAALELLKQTRVQASAVPVASQSRDMTAVDAYGHALASDLAANATTHGADKPEDDELIDYSAPDAPTRILETGPVEAAPEAAKEQKAYAGEFYPTVRRGGPGSGPKGFSLVELLVVIGVIGILIAVLLPALIGARRSADTIACSANLRSIGQGMAIYLQNNRNTFPPAYLYIGHKIENGRQTPTSPAAGYIHWSSYLYGTGGVAANAFLCPAMRQGGLPPTNTPPPNRDPGQVCPGDTVVDQQAPRLAYSVNEALCPRNKFVAASFGSPRTYRFVKITEVGHSSATILGMEMIDNAVAVSYGEAEGWIMSHRPISGFVGLNGEVDSYLIPVGTPFRQAAAADLDADPNSVGEATHTRLDLVGRNHGAKKGYPDRRLTNFLYCDGHCETKSVYDTVTPAFEWGEKFYSLVPNDDQVAP